MNKSYIKLVWRGVKKSLTRFLSILAIVAIGVGFLGGLLATTPDMQLTVDRYYDENNIYDVNIKGELGLTPEDLKAVESLDYVSGAMPAYVTDVIMSSSATATSYVTRLYGIENIEDGSAINSFILTDGRMPENEKECVVTAPDGYTSSVKIGDKLEISDTNKNFDTIGDTYAQTSFTIVGMAKSPVYMSYEGEPSNVGSGTVDLVLFASDKAYALDVYTDLFVTLKGGRELNAFSPEYTALADDKSAALKDFGIERSEIRYNSVIDEANGKLNDARNEYEDKKAEADKKLADAKAEIDDAEKKITDGEKELTDRKAELADGEKKLADAQTELTTTIAQKRQEFADSLEGLVNDQYNELLGQINSALADGEAQIADGRSQIEAGKAELAQNEELLTSTEAQLKAGREQYNSGMAELQKNKDNLAIEKQQLADKIEGFNELIAQKRTELEASKEFMTEDEYKAALAQIDQIEIEGKAKFAAAQTQLDEADAALAAGEEQLRLTDEELTAGESQLAAGKAALEQGKAQLSEQESLLNSSEAELYSKIDSSKAELDASVPTIRQAISDAAESQINAAETDAQALIDEQRGVIEDGKVKIADAEKELADGRAELAKGKKEYDDSKAEADEKLADAKIKLDDAQKEIDDIDLPKWHALTLEDNVSYVSYKGNSEKIAAIAQVFPVFFFLVAALVALTTMTRMVEEERTQIGTLKALGYSKGTILSYYMGYGIVASLLGSILGIILGFYTLPGVISGAYSMMYALPKTIMIFRWNYALVVIPIAVICTTAATLFACLGQLHERPATLMLPKAPKAGKRILLERITPLWKKLAFTQKVAARNIFRYKKRLYMTVFGIAGCCALLVAGFGIRDSIRDISAKQFGDIYKYSLSMNLKVDPAEDKEIKSILDNKSFVTDYTSVHGESLKMGKESLTLYVPKDNDKLGDQINLRNRISGEQLTFDDNSVILTEKLCEVFKLSVGDSFTVEDSDGKKVDLTLTGITENYISSFLFISEPTYKELFGGEPEYRTVLAKLADTTPAFRDEVSNEILKSDNVLYISFIDSIKESFENTVKNIDYIVIVLIISAGGLAVIVLYNLTNINICERKRELATTKVLGFHQKEVAAYIYRETTILCIIGIFVGFALGVFLHGFVMQTAEVDAVMFGRQIYPLSFVLAAVITLAFTALVDIIMLKKLRDINMVESMKANE